MGILDNNQTQKQPEPKTESSEKIELNNSDFISNKEIESWFNEVEEFYSKKVCMVIGPDGTGKSGLVMNHVANILQNDNTAKALYLDLDQNAGPLLKYYEGLKGRLIYKDPIKICIEKISNNNNNEDDININWVKLMSIIKKVANFVAINYKKLNIKCFVLDGLTKLLTCAENQMRISKHIQADGGVNQQYWKLRKKYFFDVVDIIKTIPIDTFYIGHDNFRLSESMTAIQRDTNAMMFQRIVCEADRTKENEFNLIATIEKSKLNPLKENKSYVFMEIKDNNVKFNSQQVFGGL